MRVPATPEHFFDDPVGVPRLIRRWTRRRACKRALRQAYLEYRVTHTHQELYFGWHFLTGRGAEALAARDPAILARVWTRRFSYRDEKMRAIDVRTLFPAAESLLELLRAEEKRLGLNA